MYQALLAPRHAEAMALQTGVSLTTVRRVISPCNRVGPAALETPGAGGCRQAWLALEQERAFLQRLAAAYPTGPLYLAPA